MSKVYACDDTGNRKIWVPLEEGILDCLRDPFKIGEYYLHPPGKPIPRQDDPESMNGFDGFYSGRRHFATNYGLAEIVAKGASHIVSLDGKSGYILIQLTDGLVLDNPRDYHGELQTELQLNVMKLMDHGRYYLF